MCVCTGSCVCVSGRESVSVGCQEVLPPRTRVRSAQSCLRCCLLTLSGGDVTHCHIVPPHPSTITTTQPRSIKKGVCVFVSECVCLPLAVIFRPFVLSDTHQSFPSRPPPPPPSWLAVDSRGAAQLVVVFGCGDHLRSSCHHGAARHLSPPTAARGLSGVGLSYLLRG